MATGQKQNAAEDLLSAGLESLGALKDHVLSEEGMAELKGAAEDLADDAAKFIRKYPLRTVGGAFAVGVLLGAWLNRK